MGSHSSESQLLVTFQPYYQRLYRGGRHAYYWCGLYFYVHMDLLLLYTTSPSYNRNETKKNPFYSLHGESLCITHCYYNVASDCLMLYGGNIALHINDAHILYYHMDTGPHCWHIANSQFLII